MRKVKPVAQQVGDGFNNKPIQTKASMEKIGQNGVAFGRVLRWLDFKLGIAPILFSNRFPDLHRQLVRLHYALKITPMVFTPDRREFINFLIHENRSYLNKNQTLLKKNKN